MRTRVLFQDYRPDQPAHLNDGLMVAEGVLPMANGYRPLPAPVAIANGGLGARCLGAYSYRVNGVVHLLAATAAAIRKYTASGFSSLATGLSGSTDIGVRFAAAAGFVLITNSVDPIKKYDPSAGTVANLGGTPPTGRYLAVARGRVLVGYADGTERKIAWSDEGDAESWTPAPGGPGTYEFADGGDITGLGGGEIGLVFQENAITRLIPGYDGSAWQYDVLTTELGCIAPWSLCQYGRRYVFLSARGWAVTDGASEPVLIGDERVDRTFKELVDRSSYPAMSAVVDPENGLLFVGVPNATPSTKVFILHIELNRWTTASITTERLFPGLSQSVMLEQLDATFPNLDAMTTSLDDRIFQGGYSELFLFNGDHELCAMTGENLAATFTDAERELAPGVKARVRRVLPLTDAASGVTLTVGTRTTLGGTQAQTEYTTLNRSGEFPVRESGRFTQLTFEIASGTDWSYMQGADLEFEAGGRA